MGNDFSDSRKKFISALEKIVGYPYVWAGENPNTGFDCSGAVRYCWLMSGYKMDKDYTAAGMCNEFWKDCHIDHAAAREGDLRFYGPSPSQINHVMVVFRIWPGNRIVLAGARGGSAQTNHYNIAYDLWALVDICKDTTYWQRNLQYTINPFLKAGKEPAEEKAIEQAMETYNRIVQVERPVPEIPTAQKKPKAASVLKTLFPWRKP